MDYISKTLKKIKNQIRYDNEVGEDALSALESVSSLPTPIKEEVFVSLILKQRNRRNPEKKIKIAA